MRIDVTKTLGDSRLSLDCKVAIAKGSTVCISGPSGAGKSTLLHLIAGLASPTSGQIKWGDTSWFDSSAGLNVSAARRGVAMVFQEYALFPNMTVEKNIRFGLRNREPEEVNKWIRILGLEDVRQSKPAQLSGGQQQRTALARAIVADDGIILLDEPFSAIDPVLRMEIMSKIFGHFRQVGSTVIIVSHEVEGLRQYCDHMYVMKQGQLLEAPTPRGSISGIVSEILDDKLIVDIGVTRMEVPRTLYPDAAAGATVEINIR